MQCIFCRNLGVSVGFFWCMLAGLNGIAAFVHSLFGHSSICSEHILWAVFALCSRPGGEIGEYGGKRLRVVFGRCDILMTIIIGKILLCATFCQMLLHGMILWKVIGKLRTAPRRLTKTGMLKFSKMS